MIIGIGGCVDEKVGVLGSFDCLYILYSVSKGMEVLKVWGEKRKYEIVF